MTLPHVSPRSGERRAAW